MKNHNRQWVLSKRPTGLVGPEHFELKETGIPSPGDGQVLAKTLYFSFDPTQRGWLHEEGGYVEPVQIGEAMRASGLAQVIESKNPDFQKGDIINGMMTWADYVVLENNPLMPLQKVSRDYPLNWNISLFGITTLTAYFGLLDVGKIQKGDVVVVSGAAGATGSAACQIAKLKGASKVIGIAGGADKCKWIVENAGCDAAIDYKSENIEARLGELVPDGMNIFYDNVGGDALDAALLHLADKARVVICGGISSGYNSWAVPEGPRNYMNLILHAATMEGFLLFTYAERFPEAIAEIGKWVQDGKFQVHETMVEGLENAPEGLQGLFTGKNLGKMILHVADPD